MYIHNLLHKLYTHFFLLQKKFDSISRRIWYALLCMYMYMCVVIYSLAGCTLFLPSNYLRNQLMLPILRHAHCHNVAYPNKCLSPQCPPPPAQCGAKARRGARCSSPGHPPSLSGGRCCTTRYTPSGGEGWAFFSCCTTRYKVFWLPQNINDE